MEVSDESCSQAGDQEQTDLLKIPHKILIDFIDNSTLKLSSPLLNASLCTFICQQIGAKTNEVSKEGLALLGVRISKFLFTMRSKKAAKSRHFEKVMVEKWADKNMTLPRNIFHPIKLKKDKSKQIGKEPIFKKKTKTFKNLSTRGKFLNAQKLREGFEPQAIELAVSQTLTKAGKKDARFIFKKINSSTGLTAAKVRKSMEESVKVTIAKMTPEEGLGFLLRQNLSKAQYQAI